MTAEVFNEFGSRYGYPIYVFSDGTYASQRMSGKRVIFTVEGPIDMAAPAQKQLENKNKYPAPQVQKTSLWDKVAQKTNELCKWFFYGEPEGENFKNPDYVDTPQEVVPREKRTTTPVSERWNQEGKRGVYSHKGNNWSTDAYGVRQADVNYAKDGDKEVFVAHFKF